ncbi:MAG: hypothetical protein A4E66_01817 [Syntrophus sp. PtaB.Bin001]|nr:MAG: hypothetical protein A4E66_01817 [Syntrophus sp. PtaB.Bin001]
MLSSFPLMPKKLLIMTGTIFRPTMVRTTPVTSGGNNILKRLITLDMRHSSRPEKIVMPRIREMPPVMPARMEQDTKVGSMPSVQR